MGKGHAGFPAPPRFTTMYVFEKKTQKVVFVKRKEN